MLKGYNPNFTFQYVSINTLCERTVSRQRFPLHSNMFLLIRRWVENDAYIPDTFTFQYVSINTGFVYRFHDLRVVFTFQYVSINTNGVFLDELDPTSFTFQYVSINTRFGLVNVMLDIHFTFQYVSINTKSRCRTKC